jgi:ribosome maturation factor RimP
MDLKQNIENWLQPLLEELNLFLVDVKIQGGKKVEVFVDGDNGITIGQCTSISRLLETHLDGSGLVSENYTLDVSSPGMSNPLKVPRQYKKRIGRILEIVKTDGKEIEAELIAADDEKIRLKELPKPIKKGKKTASKKEESADIPKEIEIKYEEIKKSLLQELEDSWMAKTKENVIFISATQNRNTAELRQLIFEKVKQLYEVRYPYKAGYWQDYTQLQNQEPAKKPSKKR